MARTTSPAKVVKDLNLPEGVGLAEWSLEKVQAQNPRIRCILGCLRLLDDVMESNFAVLHCSPQRLEDMWRSLLEAKETIRDELVPLMAQPSAIPVLDAAVREATVRAESLEESVLKQLDKVPEEPERDEIEELRILVCVSMGKVHGFLLDILGEILSADPRSREDTDYFLSRRFAQEMDDAEWLHTSVWRLELHLIRVNRLRPTSLSAVADSMASQECVPSAENWKATQRFVDGLVEELNPKLQRIMGLRGIRIDELQTVEASSQEVFRLCSVIREIYNLASETAAVVGGAGPAGGKDRIRSVHRVLAMRLVESMRDLDNQLLDLLAFVPLWRSSLDRRRALSFKNDEPSP